MTVTSPPYDDLRTYNGYCFDFENVAKELFRVTKALEEKRKEKDLQAGTLFGNEM